MGKKAKVELRGFDAGGKAARIKPLQAGGDEEGSEAARYQIQQSG